MSNKSFMLGVGAQKAGTTWLWNYMFSRSDVRTGFVKEYHVFDRQSLAHKKRKNRAIQNLKASFKAGDNAWQGSKDAQLLNFYVNESSYFDYFAGLLDDPGAVAACDITPAYGFLEVETYVRIKEEFLKRRVDVTPVLLMREPVARLESMVRMGFQHSNKAASRELILNEMQQSVQKRADKVRSDYRATCENLSEVFGDQVITVLYENLFSDTAIRTICDGLSIPFAPGNYEKVVRKGISEKIEENDTKEFRKHYQDQYEFAVARFGRTEVAEAWGY